MTAHAILGASSAKRWMNCPGSIELSKKFPEPPESQAAAHGSAAHALCEFCLINDEKPIDWLNHWINKEGDMYDPGDKAAEDDKAAYIIDAEMVDGVQLYLDTIYADMEALKKQGWDDYLLDVEKSFRLDFIRNDMFGTNDACLFVPGFTMKVYDFKYGKGHVVEAEKNEQLSYYGLGAIREHCWNEDVEMYDPALTPADVELIIVQPRAPHKDGPVRRWTTSTESLVEDFAAVLKEAADATAIPNAKLRSGSWCLFCRAKTGCPEIAAGVKEALGTDFDELDDDELEGEGLEATAKALIEDVVSDEYRLARAMKALPLLDMFAKAISGRVQKELQAGREIPGYKLVRKRSNRKWIDTDAAAEVLSLVYEEEEIYAPAKLLSFTQIEKLPGGKSIVADLVHKPEGGLTVAEIDDPREAVLSSVGDDFNDLEDEFSEE